MHDIRILVVEDDQTQREAYRDAIEEYCEENVDVRIDVQFANTAEDAVRYLKGDEFDAVFVDLILSHSSNSSGNDVIREILSSSDIRLIVYVVSGTLGALSDDLQSKFTSPLLKQYQRDVPTKDILDSVVKTYKTGVTKILGRKGELETLINRIFFDHLSPNFQPWIDKDISCERELLRWTAHHLLEYLDLPPDSEDAKSSAEVSYFESEFYIHPPIRKFFATGDVVEREGRYFVLLSPSCDVAIRRIEGDRPILNVETFVLAECVLLKEESVRAQGIEMGKATWNDFFKNMKKNAKNRFNYLPPHGNVPEAILDFKRLSSIAIEDFLSQYSRLATISAPFVRDLQARFSSYYARQGQPSGTWLK